MLIRILAVTLLATGLSTPAHARSVLRTCRKACGTTTKTCLAVSGERKGDLLATCPPSGSARSACKQNVKGAIRKAKKACATLHADCLACCKAGGIGPTCPVGTPVRFTPPPLVNADEIRLPQLDNGRYLALAIPSGGSLQLDPSLRDPLTALGTCVRSIVLCVDPAARSLDDCARSAAPCLTDRPWEEGQACCPAECFDAYQAARRGGTDNVAAFRTTYIRDPSCFPGVKALLTGGRP